jgi:RHS repeat-associated protein
MKKLLYILLLLPFYGISQTTTQNFVKSAVYKNPVTTTDETKATVNVTYIDGLGRPIQQIAGKASASGKDIITHIEYDAYGRQNKEYLPYPGSSANLGFDPSPLINTNTFYSNGTADGIEDTSNPYTQKFFEASPLNRVKKQAAPGNVWVGNPADDNDHTVKYAYLANAASGEPILKFIANSQWNPLTKQYETTITGSSYYAAGELYKTITQDENKTGAISVTNLSTNYGTTEEFKNKEGQLVLKRTYNTYVDKRFGTTAPEILSTYYVYDQFGNLSYVLPPALYGTFNENNSYQYRYDGRNRVTEKKIPGKQWEYIVYDALDRVVATGPAYSPFGTGEEGWLYNTYDAYGRPAVSGWYPAAGINSTSRKVAQDSNTTAYSLTRYNQGGSTTVDAVAIDYSLPTGFTFPTGFKLLKVNYYDNYKFTGSPGTPPFAAVEGEIPAAVVTGLPTGSWTRVLTTVSETLNEVSYLLYDTKGRVLRNRTTNYLGGYTQTSNKLDFDGSIIYKITDHKRKFADLGTVTNREDFTYTPQDRLLSQTFSLNSTGTSPQLMSYNTYNEIGQLVKKNVGGTDITGAAALQKVDYSYNIRGWLKGINDVNDLALPNDPQDLFAFKINYTTAPAQSLGGNVQPLYNGNIAETTWRTATDNIKRGYGYSYDKLNQLTNAWYQIPDASVPVRNSYDEKLYYDVNGNIKNLERNGESDTSTSVIEIDDLTYTYDTTVKDRLLKVTDTSAHTKGFKDSPDNSVDDYTYDAYGNLKTDRNKGITSITYNHVNLPVEIIFNNSATTKINYIYNADGTKVKKTVTNGSTVTSTEYLGSYQYVNAVLDFFPTPEGYVKVTSGKTGLYTYTYVYNYKDHLGNNRLSYTPNLAIGDPNPVVIMDENHYYPFGLKHNGYSATQQLILPAEEPPYVVLLPAPTATAGTYKIKYQGQELQDELGLGWYAFKWRNYNPEIARFMSIDPLTEDYEDYTPYQFASNQPVHAQEIEGLENSHDLNKRLTELSPTQNDAISQTRPSMIPLKSSQSSNSSFANINIANIKFYDRPMVQGGYVGETLDIAITEGIQWLGGLVSGSDVSEETSQNIQLATNLLVVVASKGKNTNADAEVVEQLTKAEARAAKLSKTPREGKDFTKAGKEAVIDVNKAKNNGKTVCETCGTNTVPAKKDMKGVTPPKNRTEIDHTKKKRYGGSGTPDNGRVRCNGCNNADRT